MLALLTLSPVSCKRWKNEDGPLSSVVKISNPHVRRQLTRGFFGVEVGAWSWTAKNFAVTLKRPDGAAQNGAKLEVKLTIPEVFIERLHDITLNSTVSGIALAPETFSKSGNFTYERDVPASALSDEVVTVEFTVDKTLPPAGPETRDLGIIVFSVGLSAK
jgi:hypothetical protein